MGKTQPVAFAQPHRLLFRTGDLDEMRETLTRMYQPHRLSLLSSRPVLRAEVYGQNLGGLALAYNTLGQEVRCIIDTRASEPHDLLMVNLPQRGAADVRYRGRSPTADTDHAVVLSGGEPFVDVCNGYSPLILTAAQADIDRFCRAWYGDHLEQPVTFDARLPLNTRAGATLRRTVDYVVNELNRSDSLLENDMVAQSLEQYLLAVLVTQLPSDVLRRDAGDPFSGRPVLPFYIKRARDYIMAHPRDEMTVAHIAGQAGCSYRSLYAGFRRYLDTTPLAFIQDQRYAGARAELLNGGPETTVKAVAGRWRFTHLGRFAAGYRQRFGELPAETLLFKRFLL